MVPRLWLSRSHYNCEILLPMTLKYERVSRSLRRHTDKWPPIERWRGCYNDESTATITTVEPFTSSILYTYVFLLWHSACIKSNLNHSAFLTQTPTKTQNCQRHATFYFLLLWWQFILFIYSLFVNKMANASHFLCFTHSVVACCVMLLRDISLALYHLQNGEKWNQCTAARVIFLLLSVSDEEECNDRQFAWRTDSNDIVAPWIYIYFAIICFFFLVCCCILCVTRMDD